MGETGTREFGCRFFPFYFQTLPSMFTKHNPMSSRKVVILFFQAGPVATEAEKIAGEKLGARFRNASQVSETDNPEKCDAVAGAIPKIYANFPRAQVGEEMTPPAPVVAPAPAKPEVTTEETAAPASVPPVATPEPVAPVITPAPVVTEEKSTDPLAGIDESEIEGFKVYSIDAIIGMVKRGELSKVRALELEKRGKNRPTCIKRLTELA